MRSHDDQSRLAMTAVFLSVSALALAACESPPPPTAAMERARTAIEGAQQDGAQQLAAAELQQAESKLAGAQQSVAQKDMTQAKYLAEESEMDAIHADMASLAQRAENTKNELQQAQTALGESGIPSSGSTRAPKKRMPPQQQQD
jgi:hypothetical protein